MDRDFLSRSCLNCACICLPMFQSAIHSDLAATQITQLCTEIGELMWNTFGSMHLTVFAAGTVSFPPSMRLNGIVFPHSVLAYCTRTSVAGRNCLPLVGITTCFEDT